MRKLEAVQGLGFVGFRGISREWVKNGSYYLRLRVKGLFRAEGLSGLGFRIASRKRRKEKTVSHKKKF